MKLPCTLALALLFAISGSLKADEGDALALDLTTIGGKTYSHCQVMKLYPDGVAFRHARGIAKVLFVDLTPEWQKHFGYDPEKVRAYERKVKEDTLKLRETAAARADEARQAWQEANEAAAQAQNLGIPYDGMGQGGGYYGYNGFMPMDFLGLGNNENSFRSPLRRASGLQGADGRFLNEGSSPVTVPIYGRVHANQVPVSANGFNSTGVIARPWLAPRVLRTRAVFKTK